jgi:hypothetical protein
MSEYNKQPKCPPAKPATPAQPLPKKSQTGDAPNFDIENIYKS